MGEALRNDKRALVTGANSGIGHVFAKVLALENYHVTGVARSEVELKSICQKLGAEHKYFQ